MSDYTTFVDWLTDHDTTLHPAIHIDQSTQRPRGLYTTANVSEGTVLCTIPSSIVIYEPNPCLQPYIDLNLPDYLQLICWLLHEHTLHDASQYYPWIQLLPINDDKHAVIQQRIELTQLVDNTTLQAALASRTEELHTLYTQLHNLLCSPHTDDDNGDDSSETIVDDAHAHWFNQVTFDQFCAADFTVWSRCLGIPDPDGQQQYLALIPYIDFVNHSNRVDELNARWEINHSTQAVSLIATSAIDANKQICISYGNKSNTELLYLYMFAVPDNVYDDCVLTVDVKAVLQNSRQHDCIVAILTLMKRLQLSAKLVVEADSDFSIDSWVLACIMACMQVEQVQSIEQVYDAQHDSSDDSKHAADSDKIDVSGTYNHTTALKQFDSTVIAQGKRLLYKLAQQYLQQLPDTSEYGNDETQIYAKYYIDGQRRVLSKCTITYE